MKTKYRIKHTVNYHDQHDYTPQKRVSYLDPDNYTIPSFLARVRYWKDLVTSGYIMTEEQARQVIDQDIEADKSNTFYRVEYLPYPNLAIVTDKEQLFV